ncbi:uncharacterized protein N7529_007859 [Penicillium soppii]|uniref:uncharacterized protein n=1 Tax=Penicillium soppii TaxID=69789 RepID=UPI0025475122|nr:uncharacterized protein N7529_007859 [Penicillium soppii]KAJ5860549.1 hypothetical protein N7529_007859 [Penicillium soppii]
MSYSYRDYERESDVWDERRPVSIKRYVIPPEDDRRDFMSRHEDSYGGERELVIRRKTERHEPLTISRYEREVDYEPYESEYLRPHNNRQYSRSMETLERVEQSSAATDQSILIREARKAYHSPRESEYDVVRRSEGDEDPYYYHRHRRVREHDDQRSRRELSPSDSISQAARRHGRDDYSSDDSMVYIRKETRDYDDRSHSHHRRHLAEGALVGAGAAELLRSRSKKDGEVSHGASRLGKTVGAGALGAVAVSAASRARDYYRSKSRHRSHSYDDDHASHRHSRHSYHSSHGRGRHSRSRSRSHSHSRAKTLLELGVGAAAVAAGVAALRSKSKSRANAGDRKGRSRTRSRSRAASRGRSAKGDKDDSESISKRREHMAGAGLAGAAAAAIVEKVRSHSRSRKGERSRSRSRFRQALPIVSAGLATAAATGLYEKKKSEKDEKEGERGRLRSRSRSRAPSQSYPDPTRDSAGLIEYGNAPMEGSIPSDHYYGQPGQPYQEPPEMYGARRATRSRSRSRGARYSSSSASEHEGRRRKHRSRSRDIAGAALGATGLGYAAHKYNERRKSKSREREREDKYAHSHHDHRDPYEEAYDPEPYAAAPATHLDPHFYQNANQFPPPPGESTQNLNMPMPQPYPPPPGAGPTTAQNYPAYGVPGPEQYARRADDNVRNPFRGLNERQKSSSQPPHEKKSVAFDLHESDGDRDGYETDDSSSTVGARGAREGRHHRRRRSESVPRNFSHAGAGSGRGDGKVSEDSDSTVDLPNRFDGQGRLLPERDPAVVTIEDLVNRFTKVLF